MNITSSLETIVRVLIGLPLATAYFYTRHFDTTLAYVFLAAGLMVLTAALGREFKTETQTTSRRTH
jgi:hypothetical protein